MVNINMALPEDLHKELKIAATIEGKTLKEYIIEQLSKSTKKNQKKCRK